MPSALDGFRDVLNAYAGLEYDEHGNDTPERFLRALDDMTRCRKPKHATPAEEEDHYRMCIKWKTFPAESDEMVIVQDIPFVSLCNHHMVPFTGVAHIGYVPKDLWVGLSKLPRVVQHFARQLQVQERLTKQIAEFLEVELKPRGVAVVLQAEHMCMTVRGVQAVGTLTTTSSMKGVFSEHDRTAKAEFMQFIHGGKK